MKLLVILLATCGISHAALTASVPYVYPTQAFLQLQGYSGACTIKVSTDPAFASPVTIPDFNGTEYTGASTDTGRADTVTLSAANPQTRWVIIGHNDHDRALAVATAYYVSVSGCGTASASFQTPTLGNGDSVQYPTPFDNTQPWNMALPALNFTTRTMVTDPMTGVQMQPINMPQDMTYRTGGNGLQSPPPSGYIASNYGGCTSFSGIGSPPAFPGPASSGATTGNTNPCDIYGLGNEGSCSPWYGCSVDDVALVLSDTASMRDGTNNQYTICVFTDPTAGCPQAAITVTVSNASFLPHVSGSSDPDGAWPSQFPGLFLPGWNWTTPLTQDHLNVYGTATFTAGAGVITSPSVDGYPGNGHFPSAMVAGQRIYVSGTDAASKCTPANLCTLATYTDQAHIALSEAVTGSGLSFTAYMWGIRIKKTTATGTLTVGAALKVAGSFGIGQGGSQTFECGPVFTSGDGHGGQLCVMPSSTNASNNSLLNNRIYFIATDGSGIVRSIYNGTVQPTGAGCYASANVNDLPSGAVQLWGVMYPSPAIAKLFYTYANNGAGGKSLYSLLYQGDTTEATNGSNYSNNPATGYQFTVAPCGSWFVTNLTPPSTSKDIPSQIAASWSGTWPGNPCTGKNYNATLFGTTWDLQAITANYAVFTNVINGGQDSGPAWIAAVSLGFGAGNIITQPFFTFDGTGTCQYAGGGMRWGNHHHTAGSVVADTFQQTNNTLNVNSSSYLFGGPFALSILGVLKADGVTYNANTSLPWPISGDFYTQCPAGTGFDYLIYSAATQCVTLKIAGSPGNVAPNATELSNWACAWNMSYSCPLPLVPGDTFSDVASASPPADGEHFLVLQAPQAISGGYKLVVLRNAVYEYCQPSQANGGFPYPGSTVYNGAGSAAQSTHANSWVAWMDASRLNGCFSGWYQVGINNSQVNEIGRLVQGHGGLFSGLSSNHYSLLGDTSLVPNSTFPAIVAQPVVFQSMNGPTFQGTSLETTGAGIAQSYLNRMQGQVMAVDANALNGDVGTGPEINSNSIGNVTLSAVMSCTNAYTITTLGISLTNAHYKQFFPVGWAGRYLLHDISGVGSSICGNAASAAAWGICYAYANDECVSGSSAGTMYVNVPEAYNCGAALTGQSFLLCPAVVLGLPSGGGMRQQQVLGPDGTGGYSRFLTNCLTTPGELYPYTQFIPVTASIALCPASHKQGWSTMAMEVLLPPWQTDAADRTQYILVQVQIGSGAAYARVAFGYSWTIGAATSPVGHLYATTRLDQTVTSTNVSPFAYASESSTATSCASGCTISVPRLPGKAGWYRIDRSSDDSTWITGDTVPLP